ncbi:MAG TPA: FAD binding domain-containing protein, partial [Gemmatimonadales bacterium]|nr:FAD binding domain-containing protein [Gemmatimonadales bacterium]
DGITVNGAVALGPLVTHRRLATDPAIRARCPALAEAAATVGGWQTQEVGTIGGNVCNASPAADTAPPLLAAGAVFHLAGSSGRRSVGGEEFFIDRRTTARRPDELLVGIEVPGMPPTTGEVYLKLGRRGAMEVAIVGLAVRITLDPEGTVERARIAVCSVAPRPFRATEAEAVLQGSRLEDDVVASAGAALRGAATPIDDARATAAYRRRVLPGMLARAVAECHRRAIGVRS